MRGSPCAVLQARLHFKLDLVHPPPGDESNAEFKEKRSQGLNYYYVKLTGFEVKSGEITFSRSTDGFDRFNSDSKTRGRTHLKQ